MNRTFVWPACASDGPVLWTIFLVVFAAFVTEGFV